MTTVTSISKTNRKEILEMRQLIIEIKKENADILKILTDITLKIQKDRDDYKSKYLSLKELYDKCWI
tara:strand:+ start:528 stop:728 length:201 start_codon:yes stop_codon:yes gene_type:complete